MPRPGRGTRLLARSGRVAGLLVAHRYRLLAALLSIVAGVVVLLIAREVFPYHSANHDEAVYLQQAAMLLDGRLALRPPVPEAFRPWFFVRDGEVLYPKYAPVPAGMFAVGKALVGSFRVSLAVVAAANVALCYAVAAEAFDRRTGLLAAALLLASPLFLVNSAVFLPYAPTTALNLLFAFAYLRAARDRDIERSTVGYAALAGAAVGLAFFARPYTAVLFAAPFVVHAGWQLRRSRLARPALVRHATTGVIGLCGVAVALAYNALLTGSPLVFPYQAFAPLDGLGFGYHEMLGYGRDYTPGLALRANAEVVRLLATRWIAAGPVGTALAVVGVAATLRRRRRRGPVDPALARRLDRTDLQVQLLLAGVLVSVVAGNVLFWGNLNVLGDLATPGDGLVALLGPYYHFDVLVPTAAFGAHGALVVARRFRGYGSRFARVRARVLLIAGVVVAATVIGGVSAGLAAETIHENAAVTERYERAYAPFERAAVSNAVVLLPSPYGDWLAHPFQVLRNDPGLDGPVVYALDRGGGNFAVLDAFPERTVYRYAYRGDWAPMTGSTVDARLQRVRVVSGDRLSLATELGVPDGVESVTVRLATSEGQAYYTVDGPPATVSLRLSIEDGRLRLAGPGVEQSSGTSSVPTPAAGEVTIEAFLDSGSGRGFSYRLELPVEDGDGGVRAMTPVAEVCRVPDRCGGEAAYVPRTANAGVSVDVRLTGES